MIAICCLSISSSTLDPEYALDDALIYEKKFEHIKYDILGLAWHQLVGSINVEICSNAPYVLDAVHGFLERILVEY